MTKMVQVYSYITFHLGYIICQELEQNFIQTIY